MLFEIFINPNFENIENIKKHLYSFLNFKSFLDKYDIIIYTKYSSFIFDLFKFSKLNIHFVKINNNTTTLKQLWTKNIEVYNNINWVLHYDIKDELIEFDFIKMIFKKRKNTFVKKDHFQIYENLFCINTDLLVNLINSSKELTPEFIVHNTSNYYFLKYMNIISKNELGQNIYI